MTTPDEPRDVSNTPSETGWPVDAWESGEAPPPLETSDPTDAEEEGWPAAPEPDTEPEPEPEVPVASEEASVEGAPVFGRDDMEPDPEPDPDPVASEELSLEGAPVFGRDDEPAPELEPEPEPVADEPEPEPVADEPGPEPEPVEEPEPVAAPRRTALSAPVIALVLTTVLMAIANGFVWYRVHAQSTTESARRAGLEASRDASRVLFSYDYRQLDKDFAAGKALTTGAFRKQYGETTTKVVTPVAKEKKAVVKAEVVTAGVVRADADTVVTIVYVNQVTTSSLAAAPKVDLSRVRMTMTKAGGHWLVSKVDAL